MVTIKHQSQTLVENVSLADNFWTRLSGYMFRSRPHTNGILFNPGVAMHTCFMFFRIDIVFMDANYRIIKIVRNLAPWRHTWFYFNAKYTLELPGGTFPASITEGATLEVSHV